LEADRLKPQNAILPSQPFRPVLSRPCKRLTRRCDPNRHRQEDARLLPNRAHAPPQRRLLPRRGAQSFQPTSRHLTNPSTQTEAGQTEEWHATNEAAYWAEAQRLRTKYASQIQLIIGFECDWIRPESKSLIDRSLSRFPFEFFVGSIHHMHTVPIDYDREMYEQARDIAGGSDERLFEDYFDAQLDMLQQLKPLVVGHFDLIRLKSDDMERSFKTWPGVWSRILRNLDFVAGYGGLLEINGAALRKGMSEPYPKAEICKVCGWIFVLDLRAGTDMGFLFRNLWLAVAGSVCRMIATALIRLVLTSTKCSSSWTNWASRRCTISR